MTIKPNEAYPTERISKIDELLSEKAKLQQTEVEFLALVGKGDAAFSQKEYEVAKGSYSNALGIKPNDEEVKTKIKNIDSILQKLAEDNKKEEERLLAVAAKEKAYTEAIAQADKSFTAENYADAKKVYTDALTIKPNEVYPTDRISKIDEILSQKAKLQQTEVEFLALVGKGDAAFSQKEYEVAKGSYSSALGIKTNSEEVKTKIKSIDTILQQLANDRKKEDERLLALTSQEKAYTEAMAKGNKQMEQKTYSDARVTFQEAKNLKPTELLPDEMIAKIDLLIAGNDRELAEARLKEEAYQKSIKEAQESSFNEAMEKADKAFIENDFNTAKTGYQSALAIKGTDPTAKGKLGQTEAKLAELAKLTQAYNTAINAANKHVGDKQYKAAKERYQEALQYLPDSDYPKRQIEKLDELLAQADAEQQKEELYVSKVKEGETLLVNKEYQGARSTFIMASEIKPSEPLPVQRIKEIDKLLADLALSEVKNGNLESAYMESIKRADLAFAGKEYTSARLIYGEALSVKPNEQYPTAKIAEIDVLLNELAGAEETNRLYAESVKTAQEAFGQNKLKEARDVYRKAHDYKPAETMPPLRIAELDTMIAQLEETARLGAMEDTQRLASEKASREAYDKAILAADESLAAKQYLVARTNYSDALSIFPNEKYPKDQISKIEQLIAQQEETKLLARQLTMQDSIIKANDRAFNLAMSSAKEFEQFKQYQGAIGKYNQAIEIKPNEKSNIQKLIDSLEEKIRLAEIPQEVIQSSPAVTAPVYKPVETPQATESRAQSYKTINNYEEAIRKADDSFGIKDYTVARFYYYKAGEIKPKEDYPRNQIELIRKLVDSELSSVDRSGYQQAITQADEAFLKGSYPVAKFFYNKALGIKSWEKYPKDRIQEILALTNSLLSEREEKEYRDLIAKADEAYTVKDISVARFYYNKSIAIKKDENYPRIKIKDIQKLIDQDMQDIRNMEYNKLIELADQALQSENFSIARFNYNKALNMKPDEKYPKDQLKRIKEALVGKSEQVTNQPKIE